MADEPTPPLPDEKEKRDAAFFAALGLDSGLYFRSIRDAVVHAKNPLRADPNAVPWRLCGARNIGGRVRSIAQNPRHTQLLYAGSAQGGVFKSTDGGDTWRPLGGPDSAIPIGALAIAPSDPNILYIGTGEPGLAHLSDRRSPPSLEGRLLFPTGIGVIRFDETVGRFPPPEVGAGTDCFFRIVVDPANRDRCWLATPTGLWRREAGGAYLREPVTTPLRIAPAFGAGVTDVAVSDNGDGSLRVLAAVAGFGVYRGRFTAAPAPPATVWEPRLANGLPAASNFGSRSIDRITLAVCASQPNHVYALFETGEERLGERHIKAVYHSRDGGTAWTEHSIGPDLGKQTWVDLALGVHPENPALVVAGVVDLARSFDYGKSWHRIISWQNFGASDRAQHGDQHTVLFDAANPHRLWVTNDGGISLATDIVQTNPLTERTWRKRSDGLAISQFNDITVHPQFPFIVGGGLQDNGTYVGFGGRTWYPVGDADGGEMAFEVRDPRKFIAPNQEKLLVSNVVDGLRLVGSDSDYPWILRSQLNADQDHAREIFAVEFNDNGNARIPEKNKARFVPVVEKHPTLPKHALVGRTLDAFVTTDFGERFTALNVGIKKAPDIPDDEQEAVNALAYSGGPPPGDFWVGTNQGHIYRGVNASPPTAWTDVTPMDTASPPAPIYYEPSVAGTIIKAQITRILVHPANPNYVVFSTSIQSRGRVFLSLNRGAAWTEISGFSAAGLVGTPPPAPGGPPPPPGPLPPSPVTSLAFDTSVIDMALPQVLYAGTLAGVYVIRGLPPPASAAMPAFHPTWLTFNGPVLSPPAAPGLGQLPLTLVNNLATVKLPRNPAAPAGSPESVDRHRLIVAMYGRGMHACDITPAASPPYPRGGPAHRCFIRQHLIEDGLSYPRPLPAVLNAVATAAAGHLRPELGGDPRFPAGAVKFTDVEAWDIRVDHAPFQFFDEVLDGVEFDTELKPRSLVAGERNIVYVQVQTAGWGETAGVQVHLFFAEVPAASPLSDVPGPNLQPDFWATFRGMPLSPPGAGAPWSRVATAPTVTIHPNDPLVVPFDWLVPKQLGGKVVGLLALCEHPVLDPIPAGLPLNLATVIRHERRAAYRRVNVDPFTPDVYIRDSVEDDGTPGSVAFGGRSPDIIVVPARPVDRVSEFADLLDARASDRLSAGPAANFLYVRVHSRSDAEIRARVDMFFVKPGSPLAAPFDPANWTTVAPISPPAVVDVIVPPRGHAFAEFAWNAAPAPDVPAGVMPALGLIALVRSTSDPGDPEPARGNVGDVRSFWTFFRALKHSNNAAFRTVLYR